MAPHRGLDTTPTGTKGLGEDRDGSMIRLFHFTGEEAASDIVSGGLRDGERRATWYSRDLSGYGERPRTVVREVRLGLTGQELGRFAVEVREDEVWDDEAGDLVAITDLAEIEAFVWYEIPAETVNSRGTARRVPADERRRLRLYGLDWEEAPRWFR